MPVVTRRAILGAAAAAVAAPVLARPALAQAANKTLFFVPQADLSGLDPIWTTGYVVRNHGYMVFDTLYATDSKFQVKPQMAEGHEVADNGLTWNIRLRDGLKFHDGAPVRARDCVASIKRWAVRDGFGATLMAQTNELTATDERTIRFRLKAPFPLLAEALGKLSSPVPFMMPERLASTPPQEQIREAVGSGPFRFLQNEWVAGSMAAYARFEGYLPRSEPPDGAAGGKHVHLDRVEWKVIPDPSTAISALQTGQVDWLENASADLLPIIRNARDIIVTDRDPLGIYVLLRFNHLFPPFDNVKVRQAVLQAVQQPDYLQAMVGDPSLFSECKAFFPCGTPLSTGTGGEVMQGKLEAARALLKDSGYDGTKVVIISPTDNATLMPMGEVTADLLRRLGMNVELVATDWGSVLARRASQKPPAEGGWNIFHTTAVAAEFMSPASHLGIRGIGTKGWSGWYTDQRIEELRDAWFNAPDMAAQKVIAAQMEQEAFKTVPYVPIGTIQSPTAYRKNIEGVLPGTAPVFWNLRKA
jgi:peptide/nickel transport system substrate-binding protein